MRSPLTLRLQQGDEARCVFQRCQLNTRAAGRLNRPRELQLEIVGRRHARIVAHRAEDLKYQCTFPRGLGSASEAHCPRSASPGGAFLRHQHCRELFLVLNIVALGLYLSF